MSFTVTEKHLSAGRSQFENRCAKTLTGRHAIWHPTLSLGLQDFQAIRDMGLNSVRVGTGVGAEAKETLDDASVMLAGPLWLLGSAWPQLGRTLRGRMMPVPSSSVDVPW